MTLRAGASLEVWNYSTLTEDLASHGYVVVGFDAPYRTGVVVFPDGRVVRRIPQNDPELCLEKTGPERDRCANRLLTAWTADIAFVLDRLKQLNGSIDVDGAPHGSVIQAGIRRPFMFLLSDHGHESDPEGGQIAADLHSIYDRLPPDGRAFIEIRGANHFLFSGDGALLKSHIVLRALRTLGIVGIDGRRQLAVTARCVHTFFDAYRKGASVSPPQIASPLYPEIVVLQ